MISRFSEFRQLDTIGSPILQNFPQISGISGTTLRYVVVADHICKLFDLPKNYLVVEIGAGFGGQCFILSKMSPFSSYIIYDLPEVEILIEKVLKNLSVQNVQCLPIQADVPLEKIDLVISNYVFSECDRSTQMNYFQKVIKKIGPRIYDL